MNVPAASAAKEVRHLRQILVWPLQLMRLQEGRQIQRHWEALERAAPDNPWLALTADPVDGEAAERRYYELVTFLPYVQRFLYGEGGEASPRRVFRRHDIAAVRVVPAPGAPARILSVARVDLHFFFDIDVVLLSLEVSADDLPLAEAQDLLYRFGRGYPAGWEENGRGLHCLSRVEWLATDGRVLASSDSDDRDAFLDFATRHRTPRFASHWAYLLRPLVQDQSSAAATIRYRQIEYHRMPLMAYLAMEDPRALSRDDFVRLGLVTEAGHEGSLPYSERHLADFEERYCFDRFWGSDGKSSDSHNTRYLCCGHALVVVGAADSPFFVDPKRGVLAQFRHQHFLLFLIAHFQKAALLMFSDQLVTALARLEVGNPESVKRFKREIRQRFEIFLRFTHRYWFHDVSEQAVAKGLFHLCAHHLNLDPLYEEVKERIHDMDEYLDSDSLRRQANTVVRLTVVTIFGLIGTVTTGFLGMNLIAAADEPLAERLLYVLAVLIGTVWVTTYTVMKSKRLSDFLDALSDERLSLREKLRALVDVVRKRRE